MRLLASTVAALALGLPLASHAVDGITDPQGDFLATFAGSSTSADLDVVAATVLYNASLDTFFLKATLDGNVGSTATGVYVWGVNRGAGTAGFGASLGLDGVRFDRVILVRPDATGSVAGTNLAPGTVTISGKTITAAVPGSLLPGTGFTNKLDYTFNLWPRDLAFASAGVGAISDFAPNNANFTATITTVPEPTSVALLLGGLGLIAWRRRQSNS
ncbi:PEP-CTERM sorting domain-containing protein [Roseateles sp. LYH14W]|uniref:PEP-CTERM sorting domain-containing protein n=1 Tax=Pelomonas parva TaxID=3299032 RepID=A0ABW7F6B9_9BURK